MPGILVGVDQKDSYAARCGRARRRLRQWRLMVGFAGFVLCFPFVVDRPKMLGITVGISCCATEAPSHSAHSADDRSRLHRCSSSATGLGSRQCGIPSGGAAVQFIDHVVDILVVALRENLRSP